MVTTKSEDVTKQRLDVKCSEENSVLGRVSYNLLLEFVREGVGWGWALIRGWAFINFCCL